MSAFSSSARWKATHRVWVVYWRFVLDRDVFEDDPYSLCSLYISSAFADTEVFFMRDNGEAESEDSPEDC